MQNLLTKFYSIRTRGQCLMITEISLRQILEVLLTQQLVNFGNLVPEEVLG